MNKLDKDYINLVNEILETGRFKGDRTGTGTISLFGKSIKHNMLDGFPALTTKKLYWKSVVTELIWFLSGDTHIGYLLDNNCTIWNGDCYKRYKTNQAKAKSGDYDNYIDCYCEHTDTCDCVPLSETEFFNKIKTEPNSDFSKKWGDLGPIYGCQWRSWQGVRDVETNVNINGNPTYVENKIVIDQIAEIVNQIKTNPNSRRHIVSAWAPHEIKDMVLPPCHLLFQFHVDSATNSERHQYHQREGGEFINHDHIDSELDTLQIPTSRLSLKFNLRSSDVPLGLPFNIASYGLLLEIIAKEVGMIPGELIADIGDTHIYTNQIEPIKEQLNREPRSLPTLKINDVNWFKNGNTDFLKSIDDNLILPGDFTLENYNPHSSIKIPLSN